MGIQQMHFMEGGLLAPTGLIIPYTGADTPTGWSLFSAADNKLIVGAGSTYGVTTSGGSATANISATLASAGSHSSTGYVSTMGSTDGNNAAGSHSHTVSITGVSCQDVYKTYRFLKASAPTQIPANGILLAASSLTGLTNVETTVDRFVMPNATAGTTGGSASISGSATSTSAGGHTHGSLGGSMLFSGGSNGYAWGSAQGAHTHPVSIIGTLNTKKKYLSAWSKAAAAFDVVGYGIAMYESLTPPTGWLLCDGTNGTPDMRDFFVRIGTTGNHGTSGGDNSASYSANPSSGASHNHCGNADNNYSGNITRHTTLDAWSHTHTVSGSQTITQPYYALAFVMKAP